MNKKISSFFLLLVCFAIYDSLVKRVTEYSVNLDIFYFCSIYSFVVFWIWVLIKETRNKFDKKVLMILSVPFILRIVLNLLSINQSYEKYSNLVSNAYIDYVSWMVLSVLLILVSWRKFIA